MFSVRGIGVAVIVSDVDPLAQLLDLLLVDDAEPLLLVDDQQPQVAELHVLRQQAVRAHDDLHLARREILERLLLLGLRAEAADHVDAHGKRGEALAQRLHVLKREHRRGREEGHLFAVHHGLERRAHRHFRLAVADVAAEQAIHRRRRFHVGLDVADRGELIGREVVREGVLELLLPVRVGAEGMPDHRLARGVQLQQLLGHVAHGLLDARLRPFPRRAPEPIDRRARGAGVLLDEIQALDRDEQLVFARVAQLHELLRRFADADADLLQPDEDADAMVDVHHEVADLEVAQVGQERAGRGTAALGRVPLLLEDIRLGIEHEPAGRQPEPAREPAEADQQRRRMGVLRAVEGAAITPYSRATSSMRSARPGVSARKSTVSSRSPERTNLRHPVLHAAPELHRRLAGHVADTWRRCGVA